MSRRQRLGELLIAAGVIDELQLQAALGHQRQWGHPLGKALLEKGFCSEEAILAALSRQTGVPIIPIDLSKLDRALAALIPERIAAQHRAVPLRLEGARQETLLVALGGPANLASIDQVRSASGKARIVPYLAKDSEIDKAIDILYRGYDAPPEPVGVNFDALSAQVQGETEFSLEEEPEQGPTQSTGAELLDELLGPSAGSTLLSPREPAPTPPRAERVEAPGSSPGAAVQFFAPQPRHATAARAESAEPLVGATGAPTQRSSPPPPPAASAPAAAARAEPVEAPATPAPAQVWVYGWPASAAQLLEATLAQGGIVAHVLADGLPLSPAPKDVVIAPLPVIEALHAKRRTALPGNVIVAVKSPESDLHRAQKVGARGYLGTPVDGELLLRAVRRALR